MNISLQDAIAFVRASVETRAANIESETEYLEPVAFLFGLQNFDAEAIAQSIGGNAAQSIDEGIPVCALVDCAKMLADAKAFLGNELPCAIGTMFPQVAVLVVPQQGTYSTAHGDGVAILAMNRERETLAVAGFVDRSGAQPVLQWVAEPAPLQAREAFSEALDYGFTIAEAVQC